tara:strand:+ start:544 stop:786 length:243 start_codon:yes stop_codon:yes gene_type:complete
MHWASKIVSQDSQLISTLEVDTVVAEVALLLVAVQAEEVWVVQLQVVVGMVDVRQWQLAETSEPQLGVLQEVSLLKLRSS